MRILEIQFALLYLYNFFSWELLSKDLDKTTKLLEMENHFESASLSFPPSLSLPASAWHSIVNQGRINWQNVNRLCTVHTAHSLDCGNSGCPAISIEFSRTFIVVSSRKHRAAGQLHWELQQLQMQFGATLLGAAVTWGYVGCTRDGAINALTIWWKLNSLSVFFFFLGSMANRAWNMSEGGTPRLVTVAGHLEDPNTVGPLTQLANCDGDGR